MQPNRHSRYTESWQFNLTYNNYDLRTNLMAVYQAMTPYIRVGHTYRIRISHELREQIVRRMIGSNMRGYFSNRTEWIDDATFEAIIDTYTRMFTSNEEINHFDTTFFLDGYNTTGGGKPKSAMTQKEMARLRPHREGWGLCMIPDTSAYAQDMCGWLAMTAFLVDKYEYYDDDVGKTLYATRDLCPGWPAYTGTTSRLSFIRDKRHLAHWNYLATELMQYCGGQAPFRVEVDAALFVAKWPKYRVVIFRSRGGDPFWVEVGAEYEPKILHDVYTAFLFLDFEHYDYIKSPKVFQRGAHGTVYNDKKRLCYACFGRFAAPKHLTSYTAQSIVNHKCQLSKCDKCMTVFTSLELLEKHKQVRHVSDSPQIVDLTLQNTCPKCKKSFYGRKCLLAHAKWCKVKITTCTSCGDVYMPTVAENGKIGNVRCRNCKLCVTCFRVYPAGRKDQHKCFWYKPVHKKEELDESKWWVFDFEAMFDKSTCMRNGHEHTVDKHIVNFIAMRQLFSGREVLFDSLHEFIAHLQLMAKKKAQIVLIAHNMKGYDGRLVFQHMVQVVGHIPTDIIWQGTKIMQMKIYGKITFRDSLCHVATSLAKMPDMFGLDEKQYKKGYYPYKFNIPAHQDYVGRFPAIEYYEPNMKMPEERKKFIKWYETQKGLPYNFRKELEEYCLSDVRILANAMEVYMREGYEQNNGLNPLERGTIASYAMQIYKTLYMPANTIAYLSPKAQQFARAAFAGGRTDVRKMIRFWSDDEIAAGKYGAYQDVQSLYPTVQFYDPMPIGHPTITTYIDSDGVSTQPQPSADHLRTVFGFIKCDLTPMAYMHHPVVVEKKDGKLMADLYPKEKVITTC